MKKHTLTMFVAVALLGQKHAWAGQYLGFDLCKPATPEAVKKIMEDAGASSVEIKDDPDLLTVSVRAKDYPVADGRYEVSALLTKGKIYEVYIDKAANLMDLVVSKYGNPVIRNYSEAFSTGKKWIFNDKKDREINIVYISADWLPPLSGFRSTLSYSCKSLEAARIAAVDKMRADERKRNSTGKPL